VGWEGLRRRKKERGRTVNIAIKIAQECLYAAIYLEKPPPEYPWKVYCCENGNFLSTTRLNYNINIALQRISLFLNLSVTN